MWSEACDTTCRLDLIPAPPSGIANLTRECTLKVASLFYQLPELSFQVRVSLQSPRSTPPSRSPFARNRPHRRDTSCQARLAFIQVVRRQFTFPIARTKISHPRHVTIYIKSESNRGRCFYLKGRIFLQRLRETCKIHKPAFLSALLQASLCGA